MSNERTGVLELTLGDTYIGSAYSPQVEVTDTATGHEVAITYMSPEGITTERFDVADGETGPQGPAGYSPTVTITDTPTGHTVTITDAQGQHSYNVPNYAQEEQERQDAWDTLSGEVIDAISAAESATSAATTAASSATSAASSATSAAQAANTAASSATTAASSANAAATAANTAASDASAAATGANAAASAASSAADDASDAADEARQIAEDIQEELDAKADTHGQYPSLSVGRADALTGADESAQWATRVTAGSGAATVRSVQGSAVVWNQLVGADTSTVTIPSDHKYLSVIGSTSAIATSDGTAVSVTGGTDQLFDLTRMFGAGNEPATVAEFERMFPEPYYPYSAPTLKPVQIAGIASTDAHGGELDSVEWTAQTLRAVGSVRDELTSDHVDVRVGVVDMGTLTWAYDRNNQYFTCTTITTRAPGFSTIKCSKYETASSASTANLPDKQIVGGNSSVTLYIKDTDYTDAATFKASLSGVMLYYALATPTTTPISPALPMSYQIEQGGTESIIVPEGEVSAAPVLTVAEGESAADLVMDALACIAAPDGPVATSSHVIDTYLTMQGKLYKVTRAIAVGETIAAGTNVTATTVMAELIARTA